MSFTAEILQYLDKKKRTLSDKTKCPQTQTE